jgi:hypothetical protein
MSIGEITSIQIRMIAVICDYITDDEIKKWK